MVPKTPQWSHNPPWMAWNQPQFGLYGSPLINMNMSSFELFHDIQLEVIGFQMPPNIEDSGNAAIGGKVDKIAIMEEDQIKKEKR